MNMLEKALEVLKKMEKHGYEAYIVGGFVRDYCLGEISNDVDITTSARPKDLKMIFKDAKLSPFHYGSVTLLYKNMRFEITTFRSDNHYKDYRRPDSTQYIDSIHMDLKRRDFTINTLCMDSSGKIIDLLNGMKDLETKTIRMVGDPNLKLEEDVLRILRAIRFATILHFELDDLIKTAIKEKGSLLKNLSYHRRKEELDRIFKSLNVKYGISLITSLGLEIPLELDGLSQVIVTNDPSGIYAQLDVKKYPFSKIEQKNIRDIKDILTYGKIDAHILYRYGLYASITAGMILGLKREEISTLYLKLPIKKRQDINIKGEEISRLFHRKAGKWMNEMYRLIENGMVDGIIDNTYESICAYLKLEGSVVDADGTTD